MANWRKVATYSAGGSTIDASITGTAYGGLDHILTLSEGGVNTDTSGWAAKSTPFFNGGAWSTIAGPGGADLLLVSNDSGEWEWKDVNDFHDHDSTYAQMSGESVFSGNLVCLGQVTAATMEVIELSPINQADGSSIILNASGGSANGDGCGILVDINANTNPDAGDPQIVWNHASLRWQLGKVGNMYDVGMVDGTADAVSGEAADYAGMFGTDSDGNVFVSV